MKMNFLMLILCSFALSFPSAAQLNLDFEQLNPDSSLVKWKAKTTPGIINGFSSVADSVTKYAGRFSLMLQSTDSYKEGSFGAKSASIPADFIGNQIMLKGFLKTTDVVGYAGLWMRVEDAEGEIVSFNNMADQEINGTRDWASYGFTLDLPENSKKIVYGILLVGTGTMWADNLEITADNVPVEKAAKKEIKQASAAEAGKGIKETRDVPVERHLE